MLIKCITCPSCGLTIYSRTRHDFKHCSCQKCAIDGGPEYVRLIYSEDMGTLKVFQLKFDLTEKDLYDDWNKNKNRFGEITPNQLEVMKKY